MTIKENVICTLCKSKITDDNAWINNNKVYRICLNCYDKIVLSNKLKGIENILYSRLSSRAYKLVKRCDISFEFTKEELAEKLIKSSTIDYDMIFHPWYYNIDHIIPMNSYTFYINDIFQIEEFNKCFDLRNLRLVKAYDNATKGSKIQNDLIEEYDLEDLLPLD